MKTARRQQRKLPVDVNQKLHVKRGDSVYVLSGKCKGQTGIVQKIIRRPAPMLAKVIVGGVNMVKKAVKPNYQAGQPGGLIAMEAAMPISKLKKLNADQQPKASAAEKKASAPKKRSSKKAAPVADAQPVETVEVSVEPSTEESV